MRVPWLALLLAVLCLCPLGLEACHPSRPSRSADDDPKFYDYTTPHIESLATFRQLSALPPNVDDRPAVAGAKFVISHFSEPARRRLSFLDGRYYQFHDEWAWFRLLNGQSVAGMDAMERHAFAAPEDARRWARAHEDTLPDGLELADGRLYARHFYDLSLAGSERELGAGSLVHVEARGQHPEVWGFELDYTDPAGADELRTFFSELRKAIDPTLVTGLKWFARSPEQLAVGRALMRDDARFRGAVLTYADVSVPGETAVYTAGIVAGRLRAFRELSHLAESEPEDILLLGALPEYLPQARGLVTAIPQTPLAHLNLLAKSRQIVNAYRGGVLDDPDVQDLVRSRAPVVVLAEGQRLRLQRITEAQYADWQRLLLPKRPQLTPSDARQAPYLVDLSRVDSAALPKYAPLIGGKAVGMVQLLRELGPSSAKNGAGSLRVDVPDRPLAITVRAYREHIAPFTPLLRELFSDPSFLGFKQLRVLALEGAAEFRRKYPGKKPRELAASYENPRALGPIAAVVRQGGVVHMLRHAVLPPSFERELTAELQRRFADYAPDQGLRFRSSSTLEDIEGYNGAGLYESSTGFLEARPAQGKSAKRPSVADAVRKTWASYFRSEAFEERQQHGVDHLAADMAVLVHARFDDALEQTNGVFTFTFASGAEELAVDAQPGAVSVTNPPTDRVVIPESARVRRGPAGLRIERRTLSSLAKPGRQLLNDAELGELFELARGVTERRLLRDNAALPDAQKRRTLVLDFEFRRVAAGWPALRSETRPARFVIKQMRPLEPSPDVGAELSAAPIPRDVLARARRIESRVCRGEGLELSALEVLTDPDVPPDLGYAAEPLVAGLALTLSGLSPRVYTHLEQRSLKVSPEALTVELVPGLPLSRVDVSSGSATLELAGGRRRVAVQCQRRLEYAEPRELLRSFLGSGTQPKTSSRGP